VKKLIDKWTAQRHNHKYLHELHKQVSGNASVSQAKAQQVHDEVFEDMDCLQCANCCKSIPPMVSRRDIKRISKSLHMSPRDFADQYTLVDEDGDTVINASPCPFLLEDNKCKVYEVRPAACRAYPHSGDQVFIKNLSHHKRNMKYCPGLMEIMKRLASIG